MLISIPNKFIFIHNYKVAGTSIESALRPFTFKNNFDKKLANKISISLKKFGLKNIINKNWVPVSSKNFPQHTKIIELKRYIPKKYFTNFLKFGFVRNPWDWQVSLYHYMLKSLNHPQHELAKSFKDFSDYIHWRVNEEVRCQKMFFTDNNGKVIVDFIGKFENLNSDFDFICTKLNIKTSLPHLNITKRKDFKHYYTDTTAEMVSKAFAEDIVLFNYSFG